ncbi:MAG: hypothetical protein PHV20_01385 [Bacteroidales bacterium]|nr:hypothetical protein [Bacteroidales bacterium]
MEKLELIPNKSLGFFKIGDNIESYINLPHDVETRENICFSYKSYNFYTLNVIIWTEENIIETISCNFNCYWNNCNIIKMPFEEFCAKYNIRPDKFENIYIIVNERGQNQKVYDFDVLGLQIWVWRKKIVTVLISNFGNVSSVVMDMKP